MKAKRIAENCIIASIIGMIFIPAARSYDIDSQNCMVRHCNNSVSGDCHQADEASKKCEAQKAALRKAEYEAKQREDLRRHQAAVDAAQKIEDANKALNPHN